MNQNILSEAIGNIHEKYIEEAILFQKYPTRVKNRKILIRWTSIAASIVLIVCAIPFFSRMGRAITLESFNESARYATTISYVGWSDDTSIFEGALNKEKFQDTVNTHIPIFKMDTLEELEQFKATYENILSWNQDYDDILSFDGAISKAQWDREIFYESYSMLAVYIPSNSASIRYCVERVETTENSICIYIKQANNPERLSTDNMAGWFLLMEVSDAEISSFTSFDAILNNPNK